MPDSAIHIRHTFGGGWATDYGSFAEVLPDQSGRAVIPFLTEAQDCIFELDGGPHEIGGTLRLNSSALESSGAIAGLYDYWKWGTSGTATRRRVIHITTKVLADTDDANFSTSLFTSLTSGATPSYATFDDLLIIASDSGANTPKSWDQTTAQALAGSPPIFAFSAAHKNRLWAAGAIANPSRLYYSSNVDPEDWTTTAGSIDIDPNDGDQITGIVSHQDMLFVFKGPNRGSIHMILGSSPTGSDGFSRKLHSRGLGAAWQNAIFRFGNDIGFVSQFGSVHSLATTASFGDFEQAALSRPINGWIRQYLNYAKLRKIWCAGDPILQRIYITMAISGNATNNVCLVMDYRDTQNIRWSRVPSYKHSSMALFVDTAGLRQVLAGGYDGFVWKINVADRAMDSDQSGATALAYRVDTPIITYGDPSKTKTLSMLGMGLVSSGTNGSITLAWKRDGSAEQTSTIVPPPGGDYCHVFAEEEEGGEFRSIKYSIRQSVVHQDIEVHSLLAKVEQGAESTETGITYACWDISNRSRVVFALSNGNLTASGGAAPLGLPIGGGRSTVGVSSGKWYWEITCAVSASNNVIGIAPSTWDTTLHILGGNLRPGYGYYSADGNKNNGQITSTAYGATYDVGDVIGVALNMDSGTLTFYKNNVSQGVAFTGITGTVYAAAGMGDATSTLTANFGATALTYTPPSGYNTGLYQE